MSKSFIKHLCTGNIMKSMKPNAATKSAVFNVDSDQLNEAANKKACDIRND
jgi:hypothetical protein